ncbi:hypothetical protein A3I25_01095 [Candidatus Nomurabacteria bacterium RIFCSPLOWO2_02_FULL_42_17]|uniref:pyruvate kinase n=2 Tax=Candidatus Nomuraibacteriota TaxID=1752729 RepID=A0A1F6WJH3_9BACT|nr:MAG: hypothetical protein A3B93_02415 [Candidatus Nomurabacteria bacterium RIFCSPHIGHO2_02_FULL_42_24]OGI96910.1 MAG: hypothetical protein A3I25_01095 [Candidatus Nomurabacteria bacterium RIFCSPLOWO2_02_FULL_42_17]
MPSKSQIIATIGPAMKDRGLIREMILAGMDVARLNFSWGTYEEHAGYIKNIREMAEEVGKKVPIIQDLSGPRAQGDTGHEFNKEAVEVITPKDLADLKFGLEHNVDYVAMSFVGNAGDVFKLREEIKKLNKNIPIISKIERKVALDNLDEIIKVSDAIMIARGDLGNEVPLEDIPLIEEKIIKACKSAGKPVIVATGMLFSMTKNPEPTRAEITDIEFAILNGADAVMLSEETATGKYPILSIETMEKAVRAAENKLSSENRLSVNLL